MSGRQLQSRRAADSGKKPLKFFSSFIVSSPCLIVQLEFLIQIPMPIKPGWASLDWIQILFQVKSRESSRSLLSWICKRREGAVWLQSLVWKEWSIWAFMFDTKREIWQMTSLCHYKWRYFKALCCEHNFRKCDKILWGAVLQRGQLKCRDFLMKSESK